MENLNELAIKNFREYLQIPSVHPDVNYDECLKFIEKQAKSLDLPFQVHYMAPQKPIAVVTWLGKEPSLPSILLNSHMDVVPVYEEQWTHKPFSAHIDDEKNIYARGSQDMKSVGIVHLEAIRRLKEKKITLRRTIHVSFVNDEETAGIYGMKKFVTTKAFQDLNVGFALDESYPGSDEKYILFNGERCLCQFQIHCPGQPGHGSLLTENTPGEKVAHLLGKIYEFRKTQTQLLKNNTNLRLADVTTINLTQIKGGVQTNVIPSEMSIFCDCRIPPNEAKKMHKLLEKWCKEAGSDVWIEFETKENPAPVTKIDDSNIFWVAIKETTEKLGMKLDPQICMGATDARCVRGVGLPAFGFTPFNKTPTLLHANDEHLNVEVFLEGIENFTEILVALGNK